MSASLFVGGSKNKYYVISFQAFLILSSTDYSLRSESLGHILQVYHESFTSTYHQLVPDAPKLTIEQLELDYHQVRIQKDFTKVIWNVKVHLGFRFFANINQS